LKILRRRNYIYFCI